MTIRLPQPGRTLDEVCTELESNTAGSYPVGVVNDHVNPRLFGTKTRIVGYRGA